MSDIYPPGTVRAVLATDRVTAPTATALRRRLDPPAPHLHLLGEAGLAVLVAVCDRLLPQPDCAEPIDVAARLHARVATGGGDGWRYAVLPDDAVALVAGIDALDASARAMTSAGFVALDDTGRDAVLRAVQQGAAPGTWPGLDQRRWFEELLVAATEVYFSHPLALEDVGYLGMADAVGWPDVGLGARAQFEPRASARD